MSSKHQMSGFGAGLAALRQAALCVICLWPALISSAKATDEIQVYNAAIAAPGQLTIQQHLNYVANGVNTPDFPGALISNRSLNGTPEFAYGMTEWWELGFYLPFAVRDDQFLSNTAKLRTLFVSPNADQRNLFYGLNFEFSYTTPRFSQSRFGLEIRPILGLRYADIEFIVNPIVDVGFGRLGEAHFTPAARLAGQVKPDVWIGLEYYSDLGRIGDFASLDNQQHALFAVTDFKAGIFDVDLGVGYGLTAASDRLVFKTIIGYAFPVEGAKAEAPAASSHMPMNPFAHPLARSASDVLR